MRSMPPGPSRGTRGSAWLFILLAVAAAQPPRKDLTIFYNVYMPNGTAPARKSAFQGRPAAAPRPRKNWSPREVAAAIADEVGRNH